VRECGFAPALSHFRTPALTHFRTSPGGLARTPLFLIFTGRVVRRGEHSAPHFA